MKANREIRAEARSLVRGGWFFRICVVVCVLQGIGNLAGGLLSQAHRKMGIVSFGDFVERKMSHATMGLACTLPTRAAYAQMFGAGTLELFIAYVFGAIAMFGLAVVLLKALRRTTDRWFADSFGGFARPFGVAGLLFLMNLRVCLWSLLFLIPGFVAAYRYRLAWYLKVEHPDWTASQCLADSGRLMRGRKAQAFSLDVGYWGWLFVAGLILSAGVIASHAVGGSAGGLIGGICLMAAVSLLVWTMILWSAARTVFYREAREA